MGAIASAALLLALPARALSCSCVAPPPPMIALGQADAVFVGIALKTRDFGDQGRDSWEPDPVQWVFRVEQRLKGATEDTLAVVTSRQGSACGFSFVAGKTYLVYAFQREGSLSTSLCSRTRLSDRAGDEIRELSEIAGNHSSEEIDRAVVARVVAQLRSTDQEIRVEAVRSLAVMGRSPELTLPALIDLYATGTEQEQIAALGAMSPFASEPQVAATLDKAIRDNAPPVRMAAVRLLTTLSHHRDSTHPDLLRALNDPDPGVRLAAVHGVGNLGSEGRDLVPALLRAVDDADERVRTGVIQELGRLKGDPAVLVPFLRRAAADSSARVRVVALENLRWHDPDTLAVEGIFLAASRDTSASVRASALSGLAAMGARSEGALSRLEAALSDPDPMVRRTVADGLGQLGRTRLDALQILIGGILELDEDLRVMAVAITESSRHEAGALVELLLPILDDPSPKVRAWVVRGLGRLGKETDSALPGLIHALADTVATVRLSAASSLGGLGPRGTDAVPYLRRALEDTDPRVAQAAESALSSIIPTRLRDHDPSRP